MFKLSRIAFLHPSLENRVADLRITFVTCQYMKHTALHAFILLPVKHGLLTLILDWATSCLKDESHHEDISPSWHPPHSSLFFVWTLLHCEGKCCGVCSLPVLWRYETGKLWVERSSGGSIRFDHWIFWIFDGMRHFHLQLPQWSLRWLIKMPLNCEKCFFMAWLNVVKVGRNTSVICF